MANFVNTVWKEIFWVLSVDKQYGGVPVQHGGYKSLIYSFPLSIAILCLQYFLTRHCFAPFGTFLGVKSTKRKEVPLNPILQDVYAKGWTRMEVIGLAKQLDLDKRQIEAWLRQRRRQDRPSILYKFCETCWNFTCHASLFSYGVFVLWDKSWFWDITQCWTGFPHQDITSDIWWYYMISLCYYWSLFFSHHFVAVRRKDFWEMFVHHIVAIIILSFSWLSSYHRIGSLALAVHDFADIFLELAKMLKYAKYERATTFVFALFVLAWIVTRVWIFPMWIVKHMVFDTWKYLPDFPAYYTFNSLLVLMVLLNAFWTYYVLKLVYHIAVKGQVDKDVRSDDDEDDD